MSTPAEASLSNPLVAMVPSQLRTGRVRGPDGQEIGLLVIHTPSGTTIVQLSKAEMLDWGKSITHTGTLMSDLIVPAPPANGHRA